MLVCSSLQAPNGRRFRFAANNACNKSQSRLLSKLLISASEYTTAGRAACRRRTCAPNLSVRQDALSSPSPAACSSESFLARSSGCLSGEVALRAAVYEASWRAAHTLRRTASAISSLLFFCCLRLLSLSSRSSFVCAMLTRAFLIASCTSTQHAMQGSGPGPTMRAARVGRAGRTAARRHL